MWNQFTEFLCATKCDKLRAVHIREPAKLSSGMQQELFQALFPVACDAFQQNQTETFSADVRQHLFSWEGLIAVLRDDVPIAFRMWQVFPSDWGNILYLAGMCVRRTYQGIGIGESLLHYVMQMYLIERNHFIALRTQNPVMKKCFDRAVGGLSYPNGTVVPQDIRAAGILLAERLGDTEYDPDTLISRRAYQGSLYGAPPDPVNESVYMSVFGGIDANMGDAVFCIWSIPAHGGV
jgi:GNAT superfamily N-acetyltransferase